MAALQPEVTAACGEPATPICRWVFEVTGSETLADVADWFLARPAKVLLVFAVAFAVNRLVRRAVRRLVSRLVIAQDAKAAEAPATGLRARARQRALNRSLQAERSRQRAESLGAVLRSVSTVAVYTLAGVISLGEFGVSLGPLVAGAGIVGVALGFGAQALVRDFLSGIFMLVEDQFGVGDVVDVGHASGTVEAVTLRTTRLRDVHGTVWHIPNGEIRRVGNKSQQWARAVIDVGVPYDVDLDRAAAVIKQVLDSVWNDSLEDATVLEEPEIWGVESFGDSAIVIRSVLKVEPGEQWATGREVRRRLKPAFEAAGIEFPFPQRTVWMHQRSASPAAAPSAAPKPSALIGRGEPAEGAPEPGGAAP